MVACAMCGCSSFVFVKQNTAYEVRIRDGSSDVCSSDLNESSKNSKMLKAYPPTHCPTARGRKRPTPISQARNPPRPRLSLPSRHLDHKGRWHENLVLDPVGAVRRGRPGFVAART